MVAILKSNVNNKLNLSCQQINNLKNDAINSKLS